MAVKRKPAKTRAAQRSKPAKRPPKPARRMSGPARRTTAVESKPREGATQRLIREIGGELEALKKRLAELSRLADKPSDDFDEAGGVFADEVRSLVGDSAPDATAVRRAARMAVAEQAWARQLGTLLETRDVVDLLSVSKQRVSTLARDHRLIALPQAGRLRFPAWQFATTDAEDRECIATAHAALTEQGAVSPWTAASWFRTAHPSLDDKDPVAFLQGGGDRSRLLEVAERDAARLAQ